MKTDELIDLVSRDAVASRRPEGPLLGATLVTLFASTVALLVTLGPRTDLAAVLPSAPFLAKVVLATVAAIPAWLLLREAARPEVRLAGRLRWFLVPLALALGLALVSLLGTPPDAWADALRGDTLFACLLSIPLFASPMLAGLLWALQRAAVTDTARAGTLAGLCAGALSASVYALHCIEDDPIFFGVWYSLGVILVALAGRAIGRRTLQW